MNSKSLYLIGNLKMNKTKDELKEYIVQLKKITKKTNNIVGVCMPYVHIDMAQRLLGKKSNIFVGAENVSDEQEGAYTGEVSASMLDSYLVDMVIVGHSERRQKYGETDEIVNKKVLQVLSNNMMPIVCVGETFDEHKQGITNKVIDKQLKKALKDVGGEYGHNIIVAYEPIWAIGTGISADYKDIEDTIMHIKSTMAKIFDETDAMSFVVLYGGSMNENNAEKILSIECVDGGLIGGASLDAVKFGEIIKL